MLLEFFALLKICFFIHLKSKIKNIFITALMFSFKLNLVGKDSELFSLFKRRE